MFNNRIHYEKLYSYLENALEAHIFLQKGFYCTICDAHKHKYLGVPDENGNKTITISNKFCTDIISFFKQYVGFKIYVIDPLILNANFVFNCYEGVRTNRFEYHYNVTIQEIQKCLNGDDRDCEFLCTEFAMGASSDMLIGDLKQYSNFVDSLNRVLENKDILKYQEIKNELMINPENYSRYFFRSTKELNEVAAMEVVKDFNLSDMQIVVRQHGLNLFEDADKSNYYFTNIQTRSAMKDSLLNEDLTNEQKEEIKNKLKTMEEEHEQSKIRQDPNSPSASELEGLKILRDNMEDDFAEKAKKGEIDGLEHGDDETDFGDIGNVSGSYIMSLSCSLFLMVVWLFG